MPVIKLLTADPANCSPKKLTGAEPEHELTTFSQTLESAAPTKLDQTQAEPNCRHNECVFRPSEDADRLGKRVQQTVERAARLLRSMNAGEASVRCLKDIVICVTRIRSRLFPYYGDGSAHTRYIRDRSVNILFNTLDRHIRRMQLHAVIRAQESAKAVRVAFILRDAAVTENLQVFTEWEDFGRNLKLPNDSFNSVLRLVAELFDIAVLHPAIHLHESFPRHPIWDLEDDLKSTSLALNDLACCARAEDSDYRTVLLTMEQCLNPQEYDSVMTLVRGGNGNTDSAATSFDSKDYSPSTESSAGSERVDTPSSCTSTRSTARELPASGRISVPVAIIEPRCQRFADGKHDCETAACPYLLSRKPGDDGEAQSKGS